MRKLQPLKIVIGYLPKIDRLPPEPAKLGLTHRFAFALETYRPGCVDMYFDSTLYIGLVGVVSGVVRADRMRVVISPKTTREVSSVEGLQKLLEPIPEVEREPFQRVVLLKASAVLAAIESEPWAQVGGPNPYHDSYTLAVFTASNLSEALLREARCFCDSVGAEVAEIVKGDDHPTKRGLLDKLRNFIG